MDHTHNAYGKGTEVKTFRHQRAISVLTLMLCVVIEAKGQIVNQGD